MDILFIIIVILTSHYIADFIFQPHSLAITKATSIKSLILHIVLYSVIFFIYLYIYGFIMIKFFTFEITLDHWLKMALGISLVNGFIHYVIDYFTSKINKYYWDTKQFRKFFLMIGLDQLAHTGLLVFSYLQMLQNFNYI